MLRVGRPRSKNKDLPLGVFVAKGRFYVRPVNAEMRRAFGAHFPDKASAPLGADKAEMRRKWVALFVVECKADEARTGTVAEIVERYEREVVPGMDAKSKREATRHCRNMKAQFGTRRYAKSEAEAATGPFLRTMDVQRYLDSQQARPVAANREVKALARMFRLARTRWGYTEYNPCLQVEYNPETPRSAYQSDDAFMVVYQHASPVLQCMMDLAQMHGARRGMLMRATLACITDDGLLLPLNKRKRTEVQRYQLIRWSDDLRLVIARVLELRAKVRGGGKVVDADTAPLFLTHAGKAFGENSFNIMWRRARAKAGIQRGAFTFHDIRAKSASDSPTIADAQDRLGHMDQRTTRTSYIRRPVQVIPLARVSGKKIR
jgi:integrase